MFSILLSTQDMELMLLSNNRKNQCRILGGDDSVFHIVRENDALVVIRVKPGCMFTGDFPHAGVRNFAVNTAEDELMAELNSRIADILEEEFDDLLAKTNAVVEVLCNFPGLVKLCRLHCSTELLQGKLTIPANTVGFTQCEPNVPDSRCTEDDRHETNKETAKDVDGRQQPLLTGSKDDSNTQDDYGGCGVPNEVEGRLCSWSVTAHAADDCKDPYLWCLPGNENSPQRIAQVTPSPTPPNSPDRF
jgi:hypothetical protein